MRALRGGAFLILLSSCVTGAMKDRVKDGEEIEAPDFTVNSPSGEWELDRRPNDILLTQRKRWLFNVVNTTTIRISRYRADGTARELPAEQVAEDSFNREKEVLRSRGSENFEVTEVVQNMADRGGKHLYYLGVKSTFHEVTPEPDKRTVSATYLYFPPSFPTSRTYYALAISQTQDRGLDEVPFDLGPLDPVLQSFRVKSAP